VDYAQPPIGVDSRTQLLTERDPRVRMKAEGTAGLCTVWLLTIALVKLIFTDVSL